MKYVPYMDDDQLFHIADNFLHEYYPSFSLPIPIENIIELKLELSIFPVKNLESGCEIDGSLSKDFKTILIDERTFEKSVKRARFTLAHEVGHYILHRDIFRKSGGFKTEQEFINFQNNLEDGEYKRLEIQAFRFAEEILFPKQELKKVVEKKVIEFGGLTSLTPNDIGKIILNVVDKFDVSERAAVNKIQRDFPSLIEIVEANIPF